MVHETDDDNGELWEYLTYFKPRKKPSPTTEHGQLRQSQRTNTRKLKNTDRG